MQLAQYFWKHIRNYKWTFFTLLFGITVGILFLDIFGPIAYKNLVNVLTETPEVERATLLPQIIQALSIIILFIVIETIGYRIAEFANNYFQPAIMRDIEEDCLKIYHQKSQGFFSNNFVGSLVSKSTRLVYGFERMMNLMYWKFYGTLLLLTSITILLFNIDRTLGYILLVWAVIFLSGTYIYNRWKVKYDLQAAEMDSKVTGAFADSLSNAHNVQIFAKQSWEQSLFKTISYKRFKIRKLSWDLASLMNAIQSVFMSILEVGLVYYSVTLWIAHKITIGEFILINTLLVGILMRLWDFGQQIRDAMKTSAECKEMIDILNESPEILDIKKPQKCTISQGNIELKNVNFTYEDQNTVFNNFNLSIKAGEKVGLVGESGSGKTTLTKILLRCNDVESGEVLIDGQNIAHIKQDDLRKNISYVPQDPILFHRSLIENIQYGDLKASKKDVFEAAKRAHAHDFIMNTADQYDTLVGERGIKLSGGERQRISIARAMLKKSPLLILDEATSALDSNAEKLIQEALDDIMKGRTTIVIAHRLSTLRKMDRIIVLDKGKIVETGSHDELLQQEGKYAELWNHQVGGFIG